MDPKVVFFSANFFGYHFRDGLRPEMGLHFRSTSAIKTGVWIWVSTHRGRHQALRYDENSSSTKAASICQATGPVLLVVPCYSPRHTSGITTRRWDVVVVIMSTTRAVAMLRHHSFCLVEDEEGSRRLGDIAVDERDRHNQREEIATPKYNPPSVKLMCRVSLVASTVQLLHGLRCSGAAGPM